MCESCDSRCESIASLNESKWQILCESGIRESWIRGFANPNLHRVRSESMGSHACESTDSHRIGLANPHESHNSIGFAAQRISIYPCKFQNSNPDSANPIKPWDSHFANPMELWDSQNWRFSQILANPCESLSCKSNFNRKDSQNPKIRRILANPVRIMNLRITWIRKK